MLPDLAQFFFFPNGFEVAVSRETLNALEGGDQGLQQNVTVKSLKPCTHSANSQQHRSVVCIVSHSPHTNTRAGNTVLVLWELTVQCDGQVNTNRGQIEVQRYRENANSQLTHLRRAKESFPEEVTSGVVF
jgi:hypothetical protein